MEVNGAGKNADADKKVVKYFIPSFIKRQQQRAARDPVYAARLRSSQIEAQADAARGNIDTGGDS